MSEVLVRIEGSAGRLTLNRPAALNALTLGMVRQIDAALTAWEADAAVALVMIDAAPGSAFCAGGDIRALYDAANARDWTFCETFFREEYRLDARIARYPKPIVTLMDGTTMGGGVGIGCHASRRVVTERAAFAMPEVRIGFSPDVGGTYLLSTIPGELGTHLALTGQRIDADDAIACGLADCRVSSDRIVDIGRGLAECRSRAAVDGVLAAFAVPSGDGHLLSSSSWIARCYAGSEVEGIVAALQAAPETEAHQAAKAIARGAPASLKLALASLRRARGLGRLAACLDQEFRVTLSRIRDPDFVEGIRAAVVDKDNAPRWVPERLQDVAQSDVERHFASLGNRELGLDA